MQQINHLENFNLALEHDDGHNPELRDEELERETADMKLIFSDVENSDRVLEDCSYLWVDPDYVGQLSPGQERCYEILLAAQQGMVYAVTTIGKLAKAQGLENPLSCYERLNNLQSLGAIAGFNA